MALEARSRARRRTCKATDFGATAVASSVDLLEEILMRLPAKPLLRFKCVSKQWYSIISEPQFTIDHAQRNPNPLLGFLFRGQPEPSGPDPIFFFISIGANRKNGGNPKVLSIPKIEIHHLCNGLLCYSEPHRDNPQLTSYYVCNSASGQSKRMRVLGTPSIKKFMAVNLAFDPVKSPFYDVIFVSETSGSELFHLIKIDIFSSKTQSWRPTSKGLFIVPYDVDFANGVYWNGAIYWYHRKKNSLAYFDFEDDCLKKLQMPSVSQGSYPMSFDYFGESGGHLHLVGTCRPRTTLFTVFEMEKDRSGWFVKCNGDLGALATAFPKMVTHKSSRRYAFSPVSVLRGEEEEEEVSIVLAIPGSVVRYNVKGKTSKKLSGLPKNYTLNEFAAQNFPLKALQYIETLASI